MAEIEKPIVARVNGDAIGFGQSLMFASDIIVAREDVRIADMHMGMGEVEPFGPPYGIVLAWTKRVANRALAQHLGLTLDAGAAYEMVTFLQAERLGGRDTTLG